MAEFGAAGAGLRDEDRRALKEGKKLLKKALGAAGVLKGGKHKEKLRREKERRRDAEARAEAERRTTMAARRAELHQRAVAEAAERRRQADSKSHAEDRARATDALEAERAPAWGQLSMAEEAKWRAAVGARLDGALVMSDGRPWRVDALALELSAASELPPHLLLHCSADQPLARWQPLLEHRASLPKLDEGKKGVSEAKKKSQPDCVLLFAPQQCTMSALKADVSQQALVLPALLSQLRCAPVRPAVESLARRGRGQHV